jgi:hypothetical protein
VRVGARGRNHEVHQVDHGCLLCCLGCALCCLGGFARGSLLPTHWEHLLLFLCQGARHPPVDGASAAARSSRIGGIVCEQEAFAVRGVWLRGCLPRWWWRSLASQHGWLWRRAHRRRHVDGSKPGLSPLWPFHANFDGGRGKGRQAQGPPCVCGAPHHKGRGQLLQPAAQHIRFAQGERAPWATRQDWCTRTRRARWS